MNNIFIVERHDYTPISWCKIKDMYDKMNTNGDD